MGAFISISAVAGDIDGSVSKVEFFAGNDKIGESLSPTSPYTIPWSASLVGPYRFTAVAHDNLGASASSMPVFVSVINTLPGGTLNLQDGINGYTGTSDTYLSTNHSTINFGFRTQLLSDSFRYTKLIRFSIFESDGGPVPDGATIQFARLSMYKLSSYDHTYRAHRMLVDWDEAEATWEQRLTGVAWSSPGGNNPTSDYFSTADGEASIGSSPGWLEIDVTASVQQMATGQPNYGWRLVPVTGNNNLKTVLHEGILHRSPPQAKTHDRLYLTLTTWRIWVISHILQFVVCAIPSQFSDCRSP
ncbi:MAG: DNRLRE domain-containing protein [Candidatus Accumulibacter sp.]|uniref:DNRLRE domain-containing protein n=1 Tax=Candidatus Accumulibacter proximus TaxID=2954385 RepID=A0A935PYP2_9PROT|nr:DNRLRE domain-containing protein [Candidatus Accumulibacter proximus]